MRAAGVVARKPHRLHDSLGAGHVEGDFVEPGNLAEAPRVLGDSRMIGAEHRPQRMRALFADFDAFLVEIVAENVDAVGAGQVVECVAVEIGQRHARRGLHEGACAEVLAHQAAVLERHPVGMRELQVGDLLCRFRAQLPALGEAFGEQGRKTEEGVLAPRRDLRRRTVGAEEIIDVELVGRDQSRHPARHLGMTGERAVLGSRQFKPRLDLRCHRYGCGHSARGERENRYSRIHNHSANQSC